MAMKHTRINGYEAELIIDALYYALDRYWTSAGDICPFTVKPQAAPVQDDDVELGELVDSLRKFLQRGENNGICPVPVNRKEVQCMMDALYYAYDQITASAGEIAVYSNAKGPENQLALAHHGYALANKLKVYNKKHAADSSWNLVIMKDEKWRPIKRKEGKMNKSMNYLQQYMEIKEAIVELGTTVSCDSFAILRSSSTGLFVIQHLDDNDNTMELVFPDEASAINLFLALCAGTVTVQLGSLRA